MVLKTHAKFDVKYLQVLDESGKVDAKQMPKLKNSTIKQMYEAMVLTRVFDEKALKLQRGGKMGTYAPVKGQEGCQIGSSFAMGKDEFVFPAFREEGVYLVKGMPPERIFQYWAGDERGMMVPEGVNVFSISITVGAHPLHAVGAAMARKIKKEKGAILTYFGDGATSEGDCLEAMNFAGAFQAPVVFLCQNNQWAISVPVKEQTAAQTLAQKAIAFGFEGIQIDGNDVFAAYKATQDAIKNAKAGKGPTFIECITYRMGDHTTSDDAKKYRKERELKEWEKKDPIQRLKKYMQKKGIFSDKYEASVLQKAQHQIDEAADKFLKIPLYKPEEFFEYMFAEKTPELREQQEELKSEIATMPQEEKAAMHGAGKGSGVVGELEEAADESVKDEKKEQKQVKKAFKKQGVDDGIY